MTVDELKEIARKSDRRNDSEWVGSLEDRKQKESEFHDEKHRGMQQAHANNAMDTYEAIYTNRKYYRAVGACSEYAKNWLLEESKGKVLLDYCCGVGGSSISAAKSGAGLCIGIDISAYSLDVAKRRAEEEGVADRCVFIQGDAENTGLPDNSVDRIICSGVLHHLDVTKAFPELQRILKPGGRILAVEALDYNPAIKLYRMRTPNIRTEWEKAHILSLKDVRLARKYFSVENIRFWHITAIAGPHLPSFFLPILHGIDRVMERIPGLQLLAWMFTFEMVKPAKSSSR